uniref:Uncharacterized protein n=1 Tax=Rhodnius prolixus TaxID=13249 RepID=T1ID98_RHOPR
MEANIQGKNTELAYCLSRFLLFLSLSPTFVARAKINMKGSLYLENGRILELVNLKKKTIYAPKKYCHKLFVFKIHFAHALIHERAFTESEVREDLLLVIIIAACENNLSDGTEVAQILKISFAILDKFLKEFSSVFHHSKMSTSIGAWSNLV